jgi:hypothetical protein
MSYIEIVDQVLAKIKTGKRTYLLICDYGNIYLVIPLICQINIKSKMIKNAVSRSVLGLQCSITKQVCDTGSNIVNARIL